MSTLPDCDPLADEAGRLLELQSFAVLDTPADPSLDDISELARRVAGTETAIISLVDQNRQWFKSCVGEPLGSVQTPRSVSFCTHTILQRDPLIVPDALADERFASSPLVNAGPRIRFYAGFPLISANGYTVGSLCVISRQPHQLKADQIDSLSRLANLTVLHLSQLREVARLNRADSQEGATSQLQPLQERLGSLERLISREQLLKMLELILEMELAAPFALMRCRLRDYDRVNATLGGLIAEEFINEAARRLLAAVPPNCSAARVSDAELVVLLPFDMEDGELQKVAERIINFSQQAFRHGGQALPMGLSIGVARHNSTYDSVESILADTSMAVRMAQRSSGSAYRFIDAETRVVARESYRFESDLREAIAARSLDAYLQPIVDLGNAEPIGFEALARWQRGSALVPPSEFLPILSEAGMTGELDLLIIEKALAAVPLLAMPIPQRPMTMSVNLSGTLLEDPDLRRRLLQLIDVNPLPTGWVLQAELLEDAFQDASADFDQFLADLVKRGVAICIDDFGTGYSSLARLISLPIQGVKVDRAFVNRLEETADSPRTLLRTMLSMLDDLSLTITAEGVETASQRTWLMNNGVSKAQGFFFHQPMPMDQAMELVQGLGYVPRAIPVDRNEFSILKRRKRRGGWRWPFTDRRSEAR